MSRCKASQAQTIRIDTAEMAVGDRRAVLVHPACDCATGCRRAALFSSPPQPEPETTDDYVVKLIARVRFGDNCDGGEVEVDWKRGVVLDLLGCYTAVDVELVEKLGEGPFPEFSLTALSACCGAGGARGVATRTSPQQTVEAEALSDVVLVPPFAYAVGVASSDGSAFAAGVSLLAVSGSGTVLAAFPVGDPENFHVFPAGTYGIRLTAETGVDPVTFELIFLIGV